MLARTRWYPDGTSRRRFCGRRRRRGATLALDCVASDATLVLAARVVAQGGDISLRRATGGTLPVAPGKLPFES